MVDMPSNQTKPNKDLCPGFGLRSQGPSPTKIIMTPYRPIYISSSSSSSCAASMVFPGPLSPHVSIVHRSWQVFEATSCIGTELL